RKQHRDLLKALNKAGDSGITVQEAKQLSEAAQRDLWEVLGQVSGSSGWFRWRTREISVWRMQHKGTGELVDVVKLEPSSWWHLMVFAEATKPTRRGFINIAHLGHSHPRTGNLTLSGDDIALLREALRDPRASQTQPLEIILAGPTGQYRTVSLADL